MGALYAICANGLSISRTFVSSNRIGLSCSKIRFYCVVNFDDSGIDGSVSLAAKKKEAKAILTSFLKEHGIKSVVAVRTVKKSNFFIEHLVSGLLTDHKSPHSVGGEVKSLDIKNSIIPYLESLHKKHGSILIDAVQNFPDPPITSDEKSAAKSPKKIKARSSASGKLPSHIVSYLVELGMDPEKIEVITSRYPRFVNYCLDENIKPVVEFLLGLGLSKSNVSSILNKWPPVCGCDLSKTVIPLMTCFEKLGVDNTQFAKMLYRNPALLTRSRQKVEEIVDFLYEMGITPQNVGRTQTRGPSLICCNIEKNLRPTAEYFRSLGFDVANILCHYPQNFYKAIDTKLKPITNFFLTRGFSSVEFGTMISRYGGLYSLSLAENMIPKWDFFLTMDYPKSELVKFPQYFSYNLETRIKPRYALVKGSRVKLPLCTLLSRTGENLDKYLEGKLDKMLARND